MKSGGRAALVSVAINRLLCSKCPIGIVSDLRLVLAQVFACAGLPTKGGGEPWLTGKMGLVGDTAGASPNKTACAGLTTEEEEEGKRAKAALEEGDGDGAGDDEDGEDGDYKKRGKFFTHLKKNEVRLLPYAPLL